MDSSTKIQKILLTLHKLSHRNAKFLENSILAVNNGIKIGFIWDIGSPVSIGQVKDILDRLKLINAINESIIVVSIKDDICVLNKTTFLEFKIPPLFIDVSKNLLEPKLISLTADEHVKEMLSIIKNQITDSSSSVIDLKVDENIYCIPSVLGVLAGYPIVYWYDPAVSKERHCITDIELVVYKVILNDNHAIYSFSVPKNLIGTEEVEMKIEAWKNELNYFKDCKIESTITKTNYSVNL